MLLRALYIESGLVPDSRGMVEEGEGKVAHIMVILKSCYSGGKNLYRLVGQRRAGLRFCLPLRFNLIVAPAIGCGEAVEVLTPT